MNTLKNNKEYFNEIHFLRAFACIGVLFVHISATYFTQAGEVFNSFTYFFNQIGRFGTPTFAVISGFLLFNQVNKRGFKFKKFVVSRTTKIIMPFVVWSIFYQFVTVFLLGGKLPEDSKVLLYNFTMGESFYHLYFMAIVVQFYLLFPLLQFIRNGFGWWIGLIVSAAVSLYFSNVTEIPFFTGILEKVIIDKVFLLHWIFYFVFGGFMAYYWKPISAWSKKYSHVLALSVVAIYVGAVVEYKMIGSISSQRETNLINIPLLSFATIGLYYYLAKVDWVKSSLQTIGQFSMGIYLIHPFTLIMLKKVLPADVWQTEMMPIMFFVVLFGTLAFVKLIQQLPNHQYIIPIPAKRKSNNQTDIQRKPVSA
ncbi:acyltransferase [Fictibacillus barbaricus]|uniref:Surface polysaccharide O-acyltransferase-like enzyme n=1 Tax=Fictibacillus barbaricus TaxID=182136 RepID=A0ABU1U219_9BACL|nr:acyltransferase [Fictibacillus barbaricus]MDR7073530.1 surface polysaccharide O-acyltransferase-like enzyme [Fictibacillus barbaricus]